ncbi:hypothetical protein MBLNU459_g6891t1 [Dothideomycetes sp. NU459]
MTQSAGTAADLSKSLSSLSIDTHTAAAAAAAAAPHRAKRQEPAESWEDEADSGEDYGTSPVTAAAPLKSATHPQDTESPAPPPPTPASPSARTAKPYQTGSTLASIDDAFDEPDRAGGGGSAAARDPDRRPEKTTSVATRLIAAGLGVRAPRRTEEQRKYDQSMREQEKRKRDEERARQAKAKEDAERAKAAIWDD